MVSFSTIKAIAGASKENVTAIAKSKQVKEAAAEATEKIAEKIGAKKAAEQTAETAAKQTTETVTEQTTKTVASKGKVKEAISKLAKETKESSHSISTIADTATAIKEKGLKEALPDIKEGTKELLGINDIAAAKEAEGNIGAIKEGAKVGVKGLFTLAGGVVGFLIPFPGAQIVGMVLGEKVGAKLVGKRYTQRIVEKAGETLVKVEKDVAEEAVKVGENLDKTV